MGAKFVALATPTATVNTNGITCKTDDDCMNGKGTFGVNKTVQPPVSATSYSQYLKTTCCMYYAVTAAPSGTAAAITLGEATLTTNYNRNGVPKTVGEYSKYC